ncbi:ATP-grasp domain-containing protein [Rhodococcus antarcticus]|uniref:biotin carboxylase n=1 Tax=Rhodococcus antarcticus TaxID=2987751 RepID=A0ABY6NY75_9NOCA|nr:biotin carboxylase N-terminal domain-containing protein [Rhodococcus antarcticus]UZJ24340.1 ATP-grasp domain-containing protein [Rhodococcus antarcticus]
MSLFTTVLVANRGEIACRVQRTLRELGITSVAIFTDADAGARHVREADTAVRIGSYLSISDVLAAVAATGAQAVHPGYGFLAENAAFARACEDAGVVFIGPSSAAIELMGDKISAKATVSAAGVPVVPGRSVPDMTDDDLVAAAAEVGYPVLVKPSAGGGGKGMHLVRDPAELPAALVSARREAASSFGDDTLFLERYVLTPRHIEVQVLADGHGHVVHLGERECSLQRRHQKVVEEAPSPLLDEATRARIGAAACETARACGYSGAGTVEFIVAAAAPEEFFFMEMNTRLQVEHPVTELVTGVDLVAEQVRVAAGGELTFTQSDVVLTGHAVEARVYAEDPARDFLPTGGTALLVREPSGAGVRVDSGLVEGTDTGSAYDPMLAKVIAHGPDRATALARLDRALAGTAVLGVGTNVAFLRRLISNDDVRAGRLDTGLIERELASLTAAEPTDDVLAAAALHARMHQVHRGADDVWSAPSGWRAGEHAPLRWSTNLGDVEIRGGQVRVGGREWRAGSITGAGPGELLLTLDGRTQRWLVVVDGDTTWLGRDGAGWAVTELSADRSRSAAAGGAELRSPMPGTVIAVHVALGDTVAAGQPLLVVEAMKMEHGIKAPHAGVVSSLDVRAGQQVKVDALLATVEAATGGEPSA